MMSPRCAVRAHRQDLKRDAWNTCFAQIADAAFSISGTGVALPSTRKIKNRSNSNSRYAAVQLQLSLRATAAVASEIVVI